MVNEVNDKLNNFVTKFKLSSFHQLNESQTGLSFIDAFWNILGWNVRESFYQLYELTKEKIKVVEGEG